MVPKLDGIAVVRSGRDVCDARLHAIGAVHTGGVVGVQNVPPQIHTAVEIMRAARVCRYRAVTVRQVPVVGQTVGVGVLGHILVGFRFLQVAEDIVDREVVDVRVNRAEVQVVVVAVVRFVDIDLRDGLAGEQVKGRRVVLRYHVEEHGVGAVVHGDEVPFVHRYGFLAGVFGTGYIDLHIAVRVYREPEVAVPFPLVQDSAAFVGVEPELHGEVTAEEDGVHGLHLTCARQTERYLMVDRFAVQQGGNHDVGAAHIAGDDVLVELYRELLAYT